MPVAKLIFDGGPQGELGASFMRDMPTIDHTLVRAPDEIRLTRPTAVCDRGESGRTGRRRPWAAAGASTAAAGAAFRVAAGKKYVAGTAAGRSFAAGAELTGMLLIRLLRPPLHIADQADIRLHGPRLHGQGRLQHRDVGQQLAEPDLLHVVRPVPWLGSGSTGVHA